MEALYKASGILIMTVKNDQVMVLLFKEKRQKGTYWIDVGGRREVYDDSSWDTAKRELSEELLNTVTVSPEEVIRQIWVPSAKYVLYLVYKDDVRTTENLVWIPLKELLKAPRSFRRTPLHARLRYIIAAL